MYDRYDSVDKDVSMKLVYILQFLGQWPGHSNILLEMLPPLVQHIEDNPAIHEGNDFAQAELLLLLIAVLNPAVAVPSQTALRQSIIRRCGVLLELWNPHRTVGSMTESPVLQLVTFVLAALKTYGGKALDQVQSDDVLKFPFHRIGKLPLTK